MQKNKGKRFFIRLLLKKFPYKIRWVPGVVYQPENNEFDKYLTKGLEDYLIEKPISRIKGVIGCWIAHSKALEDISQEEGITVVLEDDFICTPTFFQVALDIINKFNHPFDVMVFDPRGCGPIEEHMVTEDIFDPKGISHPYYMGSQCLFVNNKSVNKILTEKLNSKIKDYDGYLLYNNSIKTYVCYTGLSKNLWFGSDIEGGNSLYTFTKGLIEWMKFKTYSTYDKKPKQH